MSGLNRFRRFAMSLMSGLSPVVDRHAPCCTAFRLLSTELMANSLFLDPHQSPILSKESKGRTSLIPYTSFPVCVV